MELFWTKGYEATSVVDLTPALGVHPGSLYRVFGDKHALFLVALRHYRDDRARKPLLVGGPVLPRIRAVLIGFVEVAAEQESPRGCLIANSAGELLPGDTEVACRLAEVLSIVEDGFRQGLQLAQRQGEIPVRVDPAAGAAMVTMLLEGLQAVAKVDTDPRRLVSAVDTALRALTPEWRSDSAELR
jgi:TetR/AcrR family transcriptional repressor of nem operon